MNHWTILERIIKGDLRPHRILSKEDLKMVVSILKGIEPDKELGELANNEYPPPISEKTEIYYWLIIYETRAIKDSLERLVIEIPSKGELNHIVKTHFIYGIKLKEEADNYRLRIYEAPEAKMIDEDCYILGCCVKYLDVLLNDLIEYYLPILNKEDLKSFFYKINTKQIKRNAVISQKLESFAISKQNNSFPLFKFNVPNEKQDELIMRLYTFLKKNKKIETAYPIFKRHFLSSKDDFEKIVWKGSPPEIKFIFIHLIAKGIIFEPEENLDHLIHIHFLNKKQELINENYLSQSLSRLRGSEKATQIEKELDLIISNFKSNKI